MAPSITSCLALRLLVITTFMAFLSSLVLGQTFPVSSISAAPALLPGSSPAAPPLSSPAPALSPDITPLFPSPGGSELSPTESSLPLIPSSPSPPNPDAFEAPGPETAFAPLPDSSSVRLNSNLAVFLAMLVMLCGVPVNVAL